MTHAQGHEAAPKILRESWREWHPSFLLKARYLPGVGQLSLQQALCVCPCPLGSGGWLLFSRYFSNTGMIFTVAWLLQRQTSNLAPGSPTSAASPPGLALLSVSMNYCLPCSLRTDGPFEPRVTETLPDSLTALRSHRVTATRSHYACAWHRCGCAPVRWKVSQLPGSRGEAAPLAVLQRGTSGGVCPTLVSAVQVCCLPFTSMFSKTAFGFAQYRQVEHKGWKDSRLLYLRLVRRSHSVVLTAQYIYFSSVNNLTSIS